MRRFFLPMEAIVDGLATVKGDLYRHMAKVLRMKAGDRVILADGQGSEYTGLIKQVERDRLTIVVDIPHGETVQEEGPAITLYQGIPKGDKMDFLLQKCTELGISAIVPFTSSRTILKITRERELERLERWRRIVAEAARQSKRSSIPSISPIMDFGEAVRSADDPVRLMLWEGETANRLKPVLLGTNAPASAAVIVGPEGGLSENEAELAAANGFTPITMGKRILRTETAGIAIMAVLQFCWGDMG